MSKKKMNGIEFKTDIPDDGLWDEAGELVTRPGGMALSDAIASLLEEGDIRVSDPDMDLEHESWDFEVDWNGARFRVQVMHFDVCMVVVHGGPWLLERLIFRNVPRREDLTEHIAALFDRDPRFSEVKLFKAY